MRFRRWYVGLLLAAAALAPGCCFCRPWGHHCHRCGYFAPAAEEGLPPSPAPAAP